MKTLLLAAIIVLSACSGFNKPIQEPWPGQYESEFLYWCIPPEDGMWDVYVDIPPGCPEENISRGEWDHLPVTVGAEPELTPETIDAIEYINWKLGFEMYAWSDATGDEEDQSLWPDIIAYVAGDDPYAAARAVKFTYMGRHHGAVPVFGGFENRDRADMMIHELGHHLGLRHDADNRWSIMYPRLSNRPAPLEAKDIRALRALYAPLLREAT